MVAFRKQILILETLPVSTRRRSSSSSSEFVSTGRANASQQNGMNRNTDESFVATRSSNATPTGNPTSIATSIHALTATNERPLLDRNDSVVGNDVSTRPSPTTNGNHGRAMPYVPPALRASFTQPLYNQTASQIRQPPASFSPATRHPPPPPPPTIHTHPNLLRSQTTYPTPPPPTLQIPSRSLRPGSYIPQLTCPTLTLPTPQIQSRPLPSAQCPPPGLQTQPQQTLPTNHTYTAPTRPPGLSSQTGQYPHQLFDALNHQKECPGCVHERFWGSNYSEYHWPACRWLEGRARMGNADVKERSEGWRNLNGGGGNGGSA